MTGKGSDVILLQKFDASEEEVCAHDAPHECGSATLKEIISVGHKLPLGTGNSDTNHRESKCVKTGYELVRITQPGLKFTCTGAWTPDFRSSVPLPLFSPTTATNYSPRLWAN